MARKTPKELREEEERLLKEIEEKNKHTKPSEEVKANAIFSTMENAKERKQASFEEIKAYFEENAIGKQGSFYLNDPLMKLLRQKVVADETSIAVLVRKLLIEHYFTEEELKNIYNTIDL